MDTYIDRISGDNTYEYYGRQFPVCIRQLSINGDLPLQVHPGDEIAAQRYDFLGNVEARDVPKGACDVIVTDGFTGNVILKLTEGLAWNILQVIKKKFTEGVKAKLGAALLIDKLGSLKQEFDYSSYGGAPILGVKGPILKMHGSSSANAVKNTILKGIPYVEGNVVGTIQNSVLEIEEITLNE